MGIFTSGPAGSRVQSCFAFSPQNTFLIPILYVPLRLLHPHASSPLTVTRELS